MNLKIRHWFVYLVAAFSLFTSPAAALDHRPGESSAGLTAPAKLYPGFTQLPLAFTKNIGQWPDSILYRAEAGGSTMWFLRSGIYY
jgi:hypothetical protein